MFEEVFVRTLINLRNGVHQFGARLPLFATPLSSLNDYLSLFEGVVLKSNWDQMCLAVVGLQNWISKCLLNKTNKADWYWLANWTAHKITKGYWLKIFCQSGLVWSERLNCVYLALKLSAKNWLIWLNSLKSRSSSRIYRGNLTIIFSGKLKLLIQKVWWQIFSYLRSGDRFIAKLNQHLKNLNAWVFALIFSFFDLTEKKSFEKTWVVLRWKNVEKSSKSFCPLWCHLV